MKSKSILLSICIMAGMAGCSNVKESVIINGVKWATCNVDEVGTFAPTPESAGKLYQWNKNKAWNVTDQEVTDWPLGSESKKWEEANDPSPAGWRAPTYEEMKSLFDEEKVSHKWTTQKGVNGIRFTDKENGNSIFFPAVGIRDSSFGTLEDVGSMGYYWSSTENHGAVSSAAVCLKCSSLNNSDVIALGCRYALSIRPVAK